MNDLLVFLIRSEGILAHKLMARNVFYNKHFAEWDLPARQEWIQQTMALANARASIMTAIEEIKIYYQNQIFKS
jgi:hypothetical protein